MVQQRRMVWPNGTDAIAEEIWGDRAKTYDSEIFEYTYFPTYLKYREIGMENLTIFK